MSDQKFVVLNLRPMQRLEPDISWAMPVTPWWGVSWEGRGKEVKRGGR